MTAPRTVFVTGATGFIGSRLIPRLLQRGHTVRALVRRPEQAGHLRELGVHLHPGDVTRQGGLAEGMHGAEPTGCCTSPTITRCTNGMRASTPASTSRATAT